MAYEEHITDRNIVKLAVATVLSQITDSGKPFIPILIS